MRSLMLCLSLCSLSVLGFAVGCVHPVDAIVAAKVDSKDAKPSAPITEPESRIWFHITNAFGEEITICVHPTEKDPLTWVSHVVKFVYAPKPDAVDPNAVPL